MKFWETQHTFHHPWETVTHASWRKYNNVLTPTLAPHVNSVDIIRSKIEHSGILSTTRLIGVTSALPSWLAPVFGITDNKGYVLETTEVDAQGKTMVLRSRNVTMSNLFTVEETCTYSLDPDDPQNKTIFRQECAITANFARFAARAESTMLERFQATAQKGRDTLEKVIQLIYQEQEIPTTVSQ
eukprot:comp17150_c0_seq1/m.15963 comp17150_c0_seq1/g.15963  ORF comp17150_c0_seq1/g.15963 comp17150_c0_seq1/m.15963 type:complete len:185 (-) comp17150_c0_seq1:597-1151(-)